MKYEMIRKSAIYIFIGVALLMTLLGVAAIWLPNLESVLGKAFATVLVVGLGCLAIGYTASLLDSRSEKKEALPSFAPYPKPVTSVSTNQAEKE